MSRDANCPFLTPLRDLVHNGDDGLPNGVIGMQKSRMHANSLLRQRIGQFQIALWQFVPNESTWHDIHVCEDVFGPFTLRPSKGHGDYFLSPVDMNPCLHENEVREFADRSWNILECQF